MKEKVGIFKPEYLRFSVVLFVLGLMNVSFEIGAQ